MSKNTKHTNRKVRRDRRVRIRSIQREIPDIRKLAAAVIHFAEAQAEADAEADHARRQTAQQRRDEQRDDDPQLGGQA